MILRTFSPQFLVVWIWAREVLIIIISNFYFHIFYSRVFLKQAPYSSKNSLHTVHCFLCDCNDGCRLWSVNLWGRQAPKFECFVVPCSTYFVNLTKKFSKSSMFGMEIIKTLMPLSNLGVCLCVCVFFFLLFSFQLTFLNHNKIIQRGLSSQDLE